MIRLYMKLYKSYRRKIVGSTFDRRSVISYWYFVVISDIDLPVLLLSISNHLSR